MELPKLEPVFLLLLLLLCLTADPILAIRFPDRLPPAPPPVRPLSTAVFALGSFWRSEAAFGCVPGVVRTAVGYAGGSKRGPEYRNLGDHAECVQISYYAEWLSLYDDMSCITSTLSDFSDTIQVEYDPKLIKFKQLLDVFWSSHDPRQVFGQGPDVGNQYRSIIFTNGTLEARLAAVSKEREQTKDRSSIITTQIQQVGTFYPAESEHQKFELKRNRFLLQLLGSMPDDELMKSSLAAKLNGHAAELCAPRLQKKIDAKVDEILRNGWPVLREL